MDASRARGLIRDEVRLGSALAELQNRRFDVETAQTVRDRVARPGMPGAPRNQLMREITHHRYSEPHGTVDRLPKVLKPILSGTSRGAGSAPCSGREEWACRSDRPMIGRNADLLHAKPSPSSARPMAKQRGDPRPPRRTLLGALGGEVRDGFGLPVGWFGASRGRPETTAPLPSGWGYGAVPHRSLA